MVPFFDSNLYMLREALFLTLIMFSIRIIQILIVIVINIRSFKNKFVKPDPINLIVEFSFIFCIIYFFVYFSNFINESERFAKILAGVLFITLLRSYSFIFEPYILYLRNENKNNITLKELAEIEGMEGIKLIEIDSKVINAFAMGFFDWNKVVLITKGMFQNMSKTGIRNIIYHEIGHIREKHLLIAFLFNFISSTLLIVILSETNKFIDQLQYSHLFAGLINGSIVFLLFYVFPGLLQRILEYRADSYAARIVGRDSYVDSLVELNNITNKSLDKWTINYPNLSQRIANVIK